MYFKVHLDPKIWDQNPKWRANGEPTELERLIQAWEEPPLPEPRGEEPPLPEPRGEEPPLPEPRGEKPPLLELRGEKLPLPEPRGEAKSIPTPQPRPPPLRSNPALLRLVPYPLIQDTLPVFLDLPVLDLEPRSLQHWPQLCPWFPAPLSPSTQTSLGCCQTSLLLPLFAASLPLGDRTSLHRFPGEDLCPLWHPPVHTTAPTTTPTVQSGVAASGPLPLAPGHPAGFPGPPCAGPRAQESATLATALPLVPCSALPEHPDVAGLLPDVAVAPPVCCFVSPG
ncbi:UNVERIFIED_CONTAM: hypothetical protein FKN15_041128 [Acipenser sinensis]